MSTLLFRRPLRDNRVKCGLPCAVDVILGPGDATGNICSREAGGQFQGFGTVRLSPNHAFSPVPRKDSSQMPKRATGVGFGHESDRSHVSANRAPALHPHSVTDNPHCGSSQPEGQPNRCTDMAVRRRAAVAASIPTSSVRLTRPWFVQPHPPHGAIIVPFLRQGVGGAEGHGDTTR